MEKKNKDCCAGWFQPTGRSRSATNLVDHDHSVSDRMIECYLVPSIIDAFTEGPSIISGLRNLPNNEVGTSLNRSTNDSDNFKNPDRNGGLE